MRAIVFALGAALYLVPRVAEAEEQGRFVDRHGTDRDFRREYEAWFDNRKPHYLRAAGEALILSGLGTAYYWLDPLANAPSWDDPSLGDKLSGEAVSFDDNLTSTNFVWHPLAGTSIYGFSRLSGLGVPAAFGYAAASSLVWEYLLEWREKVSINDMIFTPFGGAALGEFFFHLSGYVSSTPWNSSFGNKMARYTIGLPHWLHSDVTPPVPTTGLPPDALGFSSAYWHVFGAGYGLASLHNEARDSALAHLLELRGELVAMPGFLRPGHFAFGFDEGNFTRARLRLMLGESGLDEADAFVSTVFFGYYDQDFDQVGGSAKMIGVASSLRFYESYRLGRRDGFAFVHFPGPAAGLWAKAGELLAFLRAEGSVDFGAIRPLGYTVWERERGSDGVKSVLAKRGYAYVFCGSSRGEIGASIGPFTAGGSVGYALCRSLQGLDRRQEQVVYDVPSTDSVLELGGYAGLKDIGPFELRVEAEELRRSGSMGSSSEKRRERLTSAVVEYVF